MLANERDHRSVIKLMPPLAGRAVMITLACEDKKTLRVNVIPKNIKEDAHPELSCSSNPVF